MIWNVENKYPNYTTTLPSASHSYLVHKNMFVIVGNNARI